ncbi:YpdA family putative bacillithiol disulfide reductase [Oceanobacillus halotolerans]|uniref:YpdA family putative bacillithiol disulfide reductase n=1 Tax=Oceanobacillus halotolerans TaxID=2663380 RepID=UPI0013DAD28D|nr:YpdA family putative bacillithiol disulfide reductase [Oceanobacillus halotolerans]
MKKESVIIIGGGPCGMSSALALQDTGLEPLIIEKGNVVNTIYQFPTHQTFFSSSDKLEIGGVPFITEKQKPVRNQALAYYRTVAERKQLRMNTYEKVNKIKPSGNKIYVSTETKENEKNEYEAEHVIIATGYYDQPNFINVPGESLPKVMHYFKEAHPYYDQDIIVIGGKNSAVDATLELYKAGARVTVLYRGEDYSKSIKPWILPEFDSLIRKKKVDMVFNAHVTNITKNDVTFTANGDIKTIQNDFVFAMTGYKPDHHLLEAAGVMIDQESGQPHYKEDTMETNVARIYVAGVVAAGYNNNKIFIENGRFHGDIIAKAITKH